MLNDQTCALGVLITFTAGSVFLALDRAHIRADRAERSAAGVVTRVDHLEARVDDLASAVVDLDQALTPCGAVN